MVRCRSQSTSTSRHVEFSDRSRSLPSSALIRSAAVLAAGVCWKVLDDLPVIAEGRGRLAGLFEVLSQLEQRGRAAGLLGDGGLAASFLAAGRLAFDRPGSAASDRRGGRLSSWSCSTRLVAGCAVLGDSTTSLAKASSKRLTRGGSWLAGLGLAGLRAEHQAGLLDVFFRVLVEFVAAAVQQIGKVRPW